MRSRTAKKIVRKGIRWKGRLSTRREAYATLRNRTRRHTKKNIEKYRLFLAAYFPEIAKVAKAAGEAFSMAAHLWKNGAVPRAFIQAPEAPRAQTDEGLGS